MKSWLRLVVLGSLFAATLSATLPAQGATSPFFGTWKLNLAKSKYTQGQPPKSTTVTYEAASAGIKVTVDGVGPAGEVTHYTYTSNLDGKDSAVTGNNPNGDTSTRTRVNANTHKVVLKVKGKVTATQTGVVSGDGKTLTITTTGTDALGKPTNSVGVYDKQ